MNKIKFAFKAALPYMIFGLVALIAGGLMALLGGVSESDVLLCVGLFVCLGGLLSIACAFYVAKDAFIAICKNCEKLMSDTTKTINYTFKRTQAEKKYNSHGEFRGYECVYTCTIECPHCGNSSVFVKKTFAKTLSEADCNIDRAIKCILKMK